MLFGSIMERMEDLKDNIEIYGLGTGISTTIGEAFEDGRDSVEMDLFNARERVEEIIDDPSTIFERDKDDYLLDVKTLEPGDVIAVSRKLPYQHFAVYIGNDRVIHFAAENGDWGGTPTIHEAPFSDFLRDSEEFEILDFEEKRSKTVFRLPGVVAFMDAVKDMQYHLYSPEETIKRAKAVAEHRMTEGSITDIYYHGHRYNLIFNNCEHFAIWCKTGVHESSQVDRLLSVIPSSRIEHRYIGIK